MSEQIVGVVFDRGKQYSKPWRAQIRVNGKQTYPGYYGTPEEAWIAAKAARKAAPARKVPRISDATRGQIRTMYRAGGVSQTELTKLFGVGREVVSKIIREQVS